MGPPPPPHLHITQYDIASQQLRTNHFVNHLAWMMMMMMAVPEIPQFIPNANFQCS